ncbi:MAG: ribonuclease III [Clostridia bacterium]|nr:ribonuclease III [Clostridia bacterium]
MENLSELEEIIGYKFKDIELLKLALTHTSYSNENKGQRHKNNERLEFLGDSVLGLVVSRYIFENYPYLPEGKLTRIRASVVCERSLWACAASIQLGKFMILGKGEEYSGGRNRMSILADAYEAVIAAIYLDGGYDIAREWILSQVHETIVRNVDGNHLKDFKTELQEFIQAQGREKIEYRVVAENGPDHKKNFLVEVTIDGKVYGFGEGNSKKNAEQHAAQRAMATIRVAGV